jgi:hypothetical protein
MPQFVSKIAPPFVPRSFEMQDGSSEKFEWLARKITMEEFEMAMSFCNHTAPGEDGIRFDMLFLTFLTTFFRMVLFSGAGKEQRSSRY